MWTWDEAKRRTNLAKHGVDFALVDSFDWTGAVVEPDLRRDYGEVRNGATGLIGQRLYVLVYAERGETIRIISLRKAKRREQVDWSTHAR